jgi:hypothetical protein
MTAEPPLQVESREELVYHLGEACEIEHGLGPPDAQAVTATFEWKELTAVTDLASASAAIQLIVEQGEGARGDWVKSLFGRFTGILEDFLTTQPADRASRRYGRSSPPTSSCHPAWRRPPQPCPKPSANGARRHPERLHLP